MPEKLVGEMDAAEFEQMLETFIARSADVNNAIPAELVSSLLDKPEPSNQSPLQCLYCQGPLARQMVRHPIDRQGVHLTIDVPAWVCAQCGKSFLDEDSVNTIQTVWCEKETSHDV